MAKGRFLTSVVIGLVVLLLAVACGGTESENTSQGSEIMSPSGAIAEAKALQGQNFESLRDEASQFGLGLMSSQEDEYKQIRDRLFANEGLASALKTADDEGVTVFLDRAFLIGTRYVNINVDATDQEIIEFLITATPETKAREAAFNKLKEEASGFGIDLWPSDEDEYKQIRDRLFANEGLASALKTADDEGVTVFLDRAFLIGTGIIFIDVDATNQEIIEFLLGK